MRKLTNRVLWALPILCLAALTASAGTVSLSWNSASNADGYRVYYGTAPGNYAFAYDAGSRTQATIGGLQDCREWYFAVKAYNNSGESQAFSGEVSGWPRPTISQPVVRRQGDQFTMTIRGSNFQSGASVSTDNPRVLLGAPVVTGCDTIELVATIEPTAPGVRAAEVGSWLLEIVNPDSVFGDLSNGIQVLINPARFDLYSEQGPSQGRVDARDTIALSRPFGARDGESLYDPDADLNGDGWIDGQDLAFLATNLGSCWSSSAADWSLAACPESLR